MSLLVVGGKTFICQECGHRVSVDYEDGAMMTQIGDLEVMYQQEIAEELNEQQTLDDRGFYLYDFGVCKSCYEKLDAETKKRSDKFNELYRSVDSLYRSAYTKVYDSFTKSMEQVVSNLTWNDISEMVGGVSKDDLIETRQHKGKRRSPLKQFIRNNSTKLEKAIIKRILKMSKIDAILSQYQEQSQNIFREMKELLKANNIVYYFKMTDEAENLNEYIVTDTSVRKPVAGSISEPFYYLIEVSHSTIRKSYRLGMNEFYLSKDELEKVITKVYESGI